MDPALFLNKNGFFLGGTANTSQSILAAVAVTSMEIA